MKIEEVKRNLNKTVWFRNAEYVFSACIIRLGENGYFYQAELQDIKNKNSIVIAKLEDLK